MMKLAGKDIKTAVINIFHVFKGLWQRKTCAYLREIWAIQKDPNQTSRDKNKVPQKKNTLMA